MVVIIFYVALITTFIAFTDQIMH